MRKALRIAWTIFSTIVMVITYVLWCIFMFNLLKSNFSLTRLFPVFIGLLLFSVLIEEYIFYRCVKYFLQEAENKSKGKTIFYIVLFVLDLAIIVILLSFLCNFSFLSFYPALYT